MVKEKDEDQKKKGELAKTTEKDALVLRQKMDELREKERTRAVTELMYLKVCNKFTELSVPMIPNLKGGGDVKFGSINLAGLTTNVYTGDAMELVREHLFKIIGQQAPSAPFMGGMAVVRIALFEAGQVYAMSSLFGYSLRNADQRFQLEKLAGNFGAWGTDPSGDPDVPPNIMKDGGTPGKTLKQYIADFGPMEVQRMLSVASVEARTAMELQVSALFGDLRVLKDKFVNALGQVNSPEEAGKKLAEAIEDNTVESLRITSEDLTRLVLEAVAYGTLLNDAEKQVNSIYELTPVTSKPQPGQFLGPGDSGGGDAGPSLGSPR